MTSFGGFGVCRRRSSGDGCRAFLSHGRSSDELDPGLNGVRVEETYLLAAFCAPPPWFRSTRSTSLRLRVHPGLRARFAAGHAGDFRSTHLLVGIWRTEPHHALLALAQEDIHLHWCQLGIAGLRKPAYSPPTDRKIVQRPISRAGQRFHALLQECHRPILHLVSCARGSVGGNFLSGLLDAGRRRLHSLEVRADE